MTPFYSIQKPCTEDWGKMSPESAEKADRHCQVCCKTVVDFSKKSNTEIVDFLQTNSDKKVCGRFKSEQLVPPAGSRAEKKNSRYRIFFAALVFVFGGMLFSSCSTKSKSHMMGGIAYTPEPTGMSLMGDTVLNVEEDTTKRKAKILKCTPDPEIPTYKMGDVTFDPADTVR